MKTRFTTVDIITVLEELQPVISPIILPMEEQEDWTLLANPELDPGFSWPKVKKNAAE